MRYERNVEIFGEDEPSEYFYKVVSGAVRGCKILSDGRRQICAFYLPGDAFGLEAGEMHTYSAEAIDEARVVVFKRSAVIAAVSRDREIAGHLLALTRQELHRTQKHALLLVKSAQERVADFLLDLMQRRPMANEIELPMSRLDIADYLGLTIETVSRTLTRLRNSATIALPSNRNIMIRNRATLNRLNS
jgi:CRP/FNR family nitrogen fixation transcriptional regulator